MVEVGSQWLEEFRTAVFYGTVAWHSSTLVAIFCHEQEVIIGLRASIDTYSYSTMQGQGEGDDGGDGSFEGRGTCDVSRFASAPSP